MGAFSYYAARDYSQAILSAQRFLSIHPGNKDAPYAYYLVAISYYEQMSDVTRDQKTTQQAMDALGELTRDRKSVVEGKGVSVRVNIGGRRIIKKKKQNK